jgi:hypothetical protein
VFSFYEAATDPIFPPLDLIKFSLQFGCGPQLELSEEFFCVEIDAHKDDPEVKCAGWMLPSDSTPTSGEAATLISSATSVRIMSTEPAIDDTTS